MTTSTKNYKIWGYDVITIASVFVLVFGAVMFITKYWVNHVGKDSDVSKLEREYDIMRKTVDDLVESAGISEASEVRAEYEAWIAKTAIQPNWAIVGGSALILGVFIGIISLALCDWIALFSVFVFAILLLYGRFLTSYLNFHSTGGFRFRSKNA